MEWACELPAMWWLDLCKLALQFLGAVVVARLTVRWALGRHKTEKTWERQSDALASVIHSINEMMRVNASWMKEACGAEFSEGYSVQLSARYTSAKTEFERVAATASLVLPANITDIIDRLDRDLRRQFEFWVEELENESRILLKARDELTKSGRALLKTS